MSELLSRLRLAPRLGWAFALVMLVMSFAALIGIWRLDSLESIASELGSTATERALLTRELHSIVVISSLRAEVLLQSEDTAFNARINADRKLTSKRSEEVRKRLDELADTPRTKELFTRIDAAGDKFRDVRNAMVKRKEGGEKIAAADIEGQLRPAADAYAGAVNDLANYQRERVDEQRGNAQASAAQGRLMLWLGVAIGAVLSAILAWQLARSIIAPLMRAGEMASRVAAGDLRDSAASGDSTGKDELYQLLSDLGEMRSRLSTQLREVRQVSESIGTASSEIATGNQDLSMRTEQTAASLQETAASMAELAGTVSQSAESARTAHGLSTAASGTAVRGGEVVTQVVTTMDEISASSRRINDIIGVIDGIAFQTNILALNAAVEAARAGEQGRGFAVVASEVRSLAQRSAAAAREIKTLIGASVERVEAGSQLCHNAGTTMKDIVGSVQRVNDIISAISKSASEQSDGIAQVNQAVNQLDQMTQQNAALVEQSAAAAESLKEQAVRLSSVVSAFKLDR